MGIHLDFIACPYAELDVCIANSVRLTPV